MPLFRRSSTPDVKKLQHRRDVEGLIALLTDPIDEVRASAAKALGEIKDPGGVEPLIAALQDPDGDVQASAAVALGNIGDPGAVDVLLHLYFQMNDIEVFVTVLKALGGIRGDRAVEVLISVLEDQSTSEEHARALARAAKALEEIGDVRAVEPLLAVQKNPAHQDFVRKAAAAA